MIDKGFLAQNYWQGCLMLLKRTETSVTCLGSAFLAHSAGYMLTSAHLVEGQDDLIVAPPLPFGEFGKSFLEKVNAVPVKMCASAAGLALIRSEEALNFRVPDDFFGDTESLTPGSQLLYLGYGFGHMNLPILSVGHAILSAKVETGAGNRILIFDNSTLFGMVGGPLVNVTSGKLVGIVTGTFNPFKELPGQKPAGQALPQTAPVGCAVVIDEGIKLLDKQLEKDTEGDPCLKPTPNA